MANETTASDIAELIPAKQVNTYISAYPLPARLGRSICWEEQGTLGVPFKFPRWSATAVPAGNKVEAAPADRVVMDTAESTATPAVVAMEVVVTDEAAAGAGALGLQVSTAMIQECIRAMDNRRDADILATASSATSTSGAFSDTLDEDAFLTGLGVFKALEPNLDSGAVCVVGHTSGTALQKASLLSTAGSRVGDGFGKMSVQSSYLGQLGGCDVWQTGNVSTESGGNNNFFTGIGRGSCGLGLVNAKEIGFEANRGSEGARDRESYLVFSMDYATVLTHASQITELRSA
jgi:hypothetical protein